MWATRANYCKFCIYAFSNVFVDEPRNGYYTVGRVEPDIREKEITMLFAMNIIKSCITRKLHISKKNNSFKCRICFSVILLCMDGGVIWTFCSLLQDVSHFLSSPVKQVIWIAYCNKRDTLLVSQVNRSIGEWETDSSIRNRYLTCR